MQTQFFDNKLRRASLGGIVALIAASGAFAQTTPPHFLGITYIKSLPGKAEEYRKFLETDAVKLAQAGVDEGTVDAIYMLRLTTPYVTGADYDYVQVVWYKGLPKLSTTPRSVWDARAKKAGFASYQAYLDKRDLLAKSVRSVWRTSIAHLGEMHMGNYIRAVSIRVDPEFRQDELNFLETYTMSLAKSRIADGRETAWGITRPAAATTSDEEAGYSFSVSNVLKDSDTLMAGPGRLAEEQFNHAVPGKSFVEYEAELNRLAPHRHNVTTRISEVVTLVGKLPMATP